MNAPPIFESSKFYFIFHWNSEKIYTWKCMKLLLNYFASFEIFVDIINSIFGDTEELPAYFYSFSLVQNIRIFSLRQYNAFSKSSPDRWAACSPPGALYWNL